VRTFEEALSVEAMMAQGMHKMLRRETASWATAARRWLPLRTGDAGCCCSEHGRDAGKDRSITEATENLGDGGTSRPVVRRIGGDLLDVEMEADTSGPVVDLVGIGSMWRWWQAGSQFCLEAHRMMHDGRTKDESFLVVALFFMNATNAKCSGGVCINRNATSK
jgi:hypothetical protein